MFQGCLWPGDHPLCSTAHGARGSPDPPWHYGSTGPGENKASVAFLSKDALGLRLVPEHSLGLQNAASRSEFCALSETDFRGVPPELAKGGLLGLVQTRRFPSKSAFTPKENIFGVG